MTFRDASFSTFPRLPCSSSNTWVCRFLLGVTLSLFAEPARAAEPLRGYGEIAGEFGFASGPLRQGALPVAPGYMVEFGVGPRALPLTLGVRAGVLLLDQETLSGAIGSDSGAVTRSTELRHAALVLRLQPDFRWVRPFVTAEVGFGALWEVRSDDPSTDGLQRETTWTRGVSLGIDVEAWTRRTDGRLDGAAYFTLGVRGFETGPFMTAPAADPAVSGADRAFRVVCPFVALTVAGWS
ncbi:MAG TPA: hypothetical protein VHE30_11630 [Polyangiaceae bacterium]|nr:hypothetical protein [Polyangiaceae bacterium]